MSALRRVLGSPDLLRRLALSSLAINVLLVITGGAVRLTGSGLGCPTWPECTDTSYVTTNAMGYHGIIEFSNRMITFVAGAAAVAVLAAALAQLPRRRSVIKWATIVLLSIPAQAVLGGITVLSHLNPWVVACHFLLSIAIIAAAYITWMRTREPDTPVVSVTPTAIRTLVNGIVLAAAAVIMVGTVVTGSGPHAGDAHARRTGLNPGSVAQLHADLVFLLVGLTVAVWFALRAVGAPGATRRAARTLLLVELAQGVIGYVQYFTHLPVGLVEMHLAGASAVWLATLALWYANRRRLPVAEQPPGILPDQPAAAAPRDGAPDGSAGTDRTTGGQALPV